MSSGLQVIEKLLGRGAKVILTTSDERSEMVQNTLAVITELTD